MTISIPWHSTSKWQPTEVTQFINHVNSGAGTLIVGTDAGPGYLKALGNPDGPHALAKDFLGTHLAAKLGLPTFDYAVIEITEIDDLPFFKSGKAEPGPAFITRSEYGATWGKDKRLLEKIDNPEAVSGLVVIDTWLRNTDRYYLPSNRVNLDNVFFSRESSEDDKLSLRAMDFRLEDAVGLIPHEWQLEPNVRSALADYLVQRAEFVAESIESRLFDPPQLTIDLSDGDKS